MSQVVGSNSSYKPITNTAWVRAQLCKLQKRCTQLAVASDKVYQLLAYGRWFSPGTSASSITKTGRHDIAEILLKVALKHQKSKSINHHIMTKYYLIMTKYYLIMTKYYLIMAKYYLIMTEPHHIMTKYQYVKIS